MERLIFGQDLFMWKVDIGGEEGGRDWAFSSAGSLPTWPEQPGLGQAEAKPQARSWMGQPLGYHAGPEEGILDA